MGWSHQPLYLEGGEKCGGIDMADDKVLQITPAILFCQGHDVSDCVQDVFVSLILLQQTHVFQAIRTGAQFKQDLLSDGHHD